MAATKNTLYSDIVVVDLTSEAVYPDNIVDIFHIFDDRECFSGGPTNCLATDTPLTSPSFSPDGDRFVALAGVIGEYIVHNSALVIFNINTGEWDYLGGCHTWDYYDIGNSAPAWNPHDDTIAFYRAVDEGGGPFGGYGGAIYLINADGSNEIRIPNDGHLETQPAWSPDGEWIVFISNRDFGDTLDLWIMDRDGENKQKIFDCDDSFCYSPSFSPDGLNILFMQGGHLFTIDLWGNNLTQVSNATASPDFRAPEWSPFKLPPVVEITADPLIINAGETTTLTWTSSEGKWAEIDNNIGAVELTDSKDDTPTETTTYTLTVSGNGGIVSDSITVEVIND
jgi:Tol biopolymer transport system component